MCLAQFLDIWRETRDLDFLLHEIQLNNEKIINVFEEVVKVDISDGFDFKKVEVNSLAIAHKKYPGFRISIDGQLGQIKQKITVDVGVDDVVRPKLLEIELMQERGALFEDSIQVNAYPPEFIFAEKLEAIIYLGEINGRMKDFSDCLQIILATSITKDGFKNAIGETFFNRGTTFTYIPDYSESLNNRWNSFVKKNKLGVLDLKEVIFLINNFLKEIGL